MTLEEAVKNLNSNKPNNSIDYWASLEVVLAFAESAIAVKGWPEMARIKKIEARHGEEARILINEGNTFAETINNTIEDCLAAHVKSIPSVEEIEEIIKNFCSRRGFDEYTNAANAIRELMVKGDG